jgi:hypothetical protein
MVWFHPAKPRKENMMHKRMAGPVVAAAVWSSVMGTAVAEHRSDFGEEIAGTYLANTQDNALIVQLGRDGSMTAILSEQFLKLGVIGESFSDTLGNWRRIGSRAIVVHSVDIAFDGETFVGVAAAKYMVRFDRHFRKALLNCTGAIFGPGVVPFSEDAEPLPGTEFACNEYLLDRIP